MLSVKSTTADNYQDVNVTEVEKEIVVGPNSTNLIKVSVPWADYRDKIFEEAILKTTIIAKELTTDYASFYHEQHNALTKPVIEVKVRLSSRASIFIFLCCRCAAYEF